VGDIASNGMMFQVLSRFLYGELRIAGLTAEIRTPTLRIQSRKHMTWQNKELAN